MLTDTFLGLALAAVHGGAPTAMQRGSRTRPDHSRSLSKLMSLSGGRVSGRVIECPGHGYCWDLLTGQSARCSRGRSRRPLGRLAVQVAGDRILLARPGAQLAGGLAGEI